MKRGIQIICRYVLAVFIVLVSLPGCFDIPDELLLPQWDVETNIPILNKKYTIQELLENQNYLRISPVEGDDSLYLLESDEYSVTNGLKDFVFLSNPSASLGNEVYSSNYDSTILYFQFPEGVEIDSASFFSGFISFNVSNTSDENVELYILLPGVITSDGEPLILYIPLEGNKSDSLVNDLAGYYYKFPRNQPSIFKNSIQVICKAYTNDPDGALIILNQYTNDLLFKSVTGKIRPKSLTRKTNSYSVDVGKGSNFRDNLFLRNVELNLQAEYLSDVINPFDVELKNINVIAKRNDGGQLMLEDSNGNPNFNFLLSEGSLHIGFNEENSNAVQFASFLPDSIILITEYLVNPDFQVGSATIEDSLKFNIEFHSTSMLALKKSGLKDTVDAGFSEKDKERIKDVMKAEITIEVENSIPLSLWLRIDLTDNNFNKLSTLTKTGQFSDSIFIPSAKVNSEGKVISSTLSQQEITLSENDILNFSEAANAVYAIYLETDGAFNNPPLYIALRATDWLKMRAFGKVKYIVRP